jgi:hypothetical protein
MGVWQAGIPLLCAALAATAAAGATTTVVDLPSRGGVQRILYVKPDAPVANIVALPGGNGRLGIQSDGSMPTQVGNCFPVGRNREAFAAQGYAVALVDMASDGSTQNFDDVSAVIRYMRERADVPVWIIGGSNSTQGVWDMAVGLPASSPVGIVFFSPGIIDTPQQALYKRPTLVVTHQNDVGQYSGPLIAAMTSAPIVQSVGLTGGSSGGCGYHLFQGLDAAFVEAVAGFIAKYNASFPPATAIAVEFHNPALDHYFLTHRESEIAILDTGATIKGWVRTGEAFAVYAGAQAGSSPVCRFYIPPAKGDSHFYGRGSAECSATGAANPTFVNEDPQFFHVVLPVGGECPAGTAPVYRVFSNRADANHRYMVSRALRGQMAAAGWLPEGDGPDLVVMCSPQ